MSLCDGLSLLSEVTTIWIDSKTGNMIDVSSRFYLPGWQQKSSAPSKI